MKLRIIIPLVPTLLRFLIATAILSFALALSTLSVWIGDFAEWLAPELRERP